MKVFQSADTEQSDRVNPPYHIQSKSVTFGRLEVSDKRRDVDSVS
jgi:hypothetical protein